MPDIENITSYVTNNIHHVNSIVKVIIKDNVIVSTIGEINTTNAEPDIKSNCQFYLTTVCFTSGIIEYHNNYFNFINQDNPQDIILKYAIRGYPPAGMPKEINTALLDYVNISPIWNSNGHCRYNTWKEFLNNSIIQKGIEHYNIENYITDLHAFT